MAFLNTIRDSLLNIVFPTKCISCGKNGKDLCIICLSEIPTAERETAKWIFPLYDYRHPPTKKTLWMLKYKGKKRLANIFAEVLYEKIMEELSELSMLENFRDPIIISIPLSAKRYKERGYNQAELICKELLKLDKDKNFCLEKNILIKQKETEHQAQIKDRNIRLRNILGSFSVKSGEENKIKNRNIILIDDITTTGATLNEARKILKKSGAKKVIAFTVAH